MTSWYFINFNNVSRGANSIISDIRSINPDNIVLLCLEEYDYPYIFREVFDPLQAFLEDLNKQATLIVPFIEPTHIPYNNIILEESYGFFHWAIGTVDNCILQAREFKFNPNIKLFTNYNNNAKYQRAMLVDEFVKYDLLKDGIVTLHQPKCQMPNTTEFYQYKYHTGNPIIDEAENDFVLNKNTNTNYHAASIPESYLNGLIDIVSESTYGQNQFFVTEKTAKPIGTLKPFLVLGPKHFHKHLLDRYHVEPYTEFFDYSFDDKDNVQDRIEGIIKNLLRLRKLPWEDLNIMYDNIHNKLLQNRKNFISISLDPFNYCPKTLLPILQNPKEHTLFGDTINGIFYALGITK